MFDCQEYKEVLGEMTVKINTTTKDWNRLLETGLWDKVVEILNGKMEEKTLMNKIFTPHELKTIEVDTEKKTFRINGEDFGEGCTGFTISCTPGEFKIRAEIDTTVEFANYSSKGELQEQGTYKRN